MKVLHALWFVLLLAVAIGACTVGRGASTAKAEPKLRFEWYDAGCAGGGFGPYAYAIVDHDTGRQYLAVFRGSQGGVAIVELVPR